MNVNIQAVERTVDVPGGPDRKAWLIQGTLQLDDDEWRAVLGTMLASGAGGADARNFLNRLGRQAVEETAQELAEEDDDPTG